MTTIDRLPPHSIDAERGALACVLLSPVDCLDALIERFPSGAAVFYDLRHRLLFQVMLEMHERQLPIDTISLHQRLKDGQQLDKVGGLVYLAALPDAAPSAVNLAHYAAILNEKYSLRRILATCTEAAACAYEFTGDIEELLDQVEREVLAISETQTQGKTRSMKQITRTAMGAIEELHENGGRLRGLSWGLPDLDKLTRGLKPAELVIIAGRPSTGKTSLAMQVVEYTAVDQGIPAGVFSLEMSAEDLVTRMLCSRARVNLNGIASGLLGLLDVPNLAKASAQMSKAPLYIDDSGGLSILQLRAKARRLWQQHDIRLLVVDYLQLLHSTNRKIDNRTQEIADLTAGCKAMAKELNIPVIAVSQLNREVEKRTSNKPRMADLREGGAIEQDADFIGLLYRQSRDDESQPNGMCPVNLYVAKQRNGPRDHDLALMFCEPFTRFEGRAPISAVDVPTDHKRRAANDTA